jgi:LPS O-antigen subunit length determinant protein (WzzB/FepE family)
MTYQAPLFAGRLGVCAGSYQKESDMKKSEMFRIAAGMKALEGMLK